MSSRRSWAFWIRGTLLAAISGHAIANVLLDADQYARAGLAYSWHAYVPLAAQLVVVVAASIAVGRIAALRRPVGLASLKPKLAHLLAGVIASQLALFLILELTERLAQREPFVDGLFGSSFAFELLFALAGALVLAALGAVALRLIRSLRRNPHLDGAMVPSTPLRPAMVRSVRLYRAERGRAPPALIA